MKQVANSSRRSKRSRKPASAAKPAGVANSKGDNAPTDVPDFPVRLPGELVHWPIDRLKPYERNTRTHSPEQITKIAASLLEFGWTNPILVDADAGIIAGHGRLLAARELGMQTVPVIELTHLTVA